MKKIYLGLFLCIFTTAYADKYYSIPNVTIDAFLHPDGSMTVEESRTYQFTGTFQYAYRTFMTRQMEAYADFQVRENNQLYTRSDTRLPGTYQITPRNQLLEVRWFYRAKNETRTFRLSYRINHIVRCYRDAAVLYYQFIGPDWDLKQRNVTLNVHPPAAADSSQIRHWLHGPLWAVSSIDPQGLITGRCRELPAHTYLELRALYLPGLFKIDAVPQWVREDITREEARWAVEANEKRKDLQLRAEAKKQREKQGFSLLTVAALGALLLWYLLYQRYGQRPAVTSTPALSFDIPEDAPPAFVGYLLNYRTTTANDLVATLFDLADRGYLHLHEEGIEKNTLFNKSQKTSEYSIELDRGFYDKNRHSLQTFEDQLVQFLFLDLAQGDSRITMKKIKKENRRMSKFFIRWQKEVRKAVKARNYYDKESVKGMGLSLGLSGIMLVLTIAAVLYFGLPAVILGITTMVVFGLSFFVLHRTSEGERLYRSWKALKKYLHKFSFRLDQSPWHEHVKKYFIYGPVLGLRKKHYLGMTEMIPESEVRHHLPWYAYAGHGGPGGFSPEGFAASFSAMGRLLAVSTSCLALEFNWGAGGMGRAAWAAGARRARARAKTVDSWVNKFMGKTDSC